MFYSTLFSTSIIAELLGYPFDFGWEDNVRTSVGANYSWESLRHSVRHPTAGWPDVNIMWLERLSWSVLWHSGVTTIKNGFILYCHKQAGTQQLQTRLVPLLLKRTKQQPTQFKLQLLNLHYWWICMSGHNYPGYSMTVYKLFISIQRAYTTDKMVWYWAI